MGIIAGGGTIGAVLWIGWRYLVGDPNDSGPLYWLLLIGSGTLAGGWCLRDRAMWSGAVAVGQMTALGWFLSRTGPAPLWPLGMLQLAGGGLWVLLGTWLAARLQAKGADGHKPVK